MKHFALYLDAAAPKGWGDTLSWLWYYKLDQEVGETYIHHPSPRILEAAHGDLLWVVVDGTPLACLSIERVHVDEINGLNEVWYEARNIRFYAGGTRLDPLRASVCIGDVGDTLLHDVKEERMMRRKG